MHPRKGVIDLTSTLKGSPVLTDAPPILRRWGTPSECFPLLPLPPVGCNDLRLLSGDASCVFCATQIIRVGNFNNLSVTKEQ